jgi:alpha-ribazole phosphatase
VIRLLLVRHGETEWNTDGRWQGQMDVPLNGVGREQAAAVAERLASEAIDAIYASDLSRAYDTALAVAVPHDIPVQADPRLREINLGDWQGLTYAEMASQYPDAVAHWNADRINRAAPGGESLRVVGERLSALLSDIQRDHGGAEGNGDPTVVLVTHGGTARLILCTLIACPLDRYWRFEFDNTALAEIELQDRGPVLICWNDTHHLTNGHRMSVL